MDNLHWALLLTALTATALLLIMVFRLRSARREPYEALADESELSSRLRAHGETILSLESQVLEYRQAEDRRQAQRVAAARRAAEVNRAAAAARKADRARAANEATAKTLAAIGTTPMRSRAQVVAPVKAARTRKRKATATA